MQPTLIPERLTEQRLKKNISKLEASKRMNLTQATYVRYENGTRNPTYATIIHMAQILDTSAEYLTGQTDISEPDRIILTKDDNPLLIEVMKRTSEMDDAQLSRLLAYCSQLN